MQDIFIASKDYKDLIKKTVTMEEISKYPILLQKQPSSSRDAIERFCQEHNFKLNRVMEVASSNLLIEFAKIGYGIGVVTKEYVTKNLQKKELFELKVVPKMPKRDFGIISLKENYLSKGCQDFLHLILKKDESYLSEQKNDKIKNKL